MSVPRAKNDIYREGNYVYIMRLTSVYCPVALLERYISMCNIELSSSVALFRPVRLFKSTNSYKLYGVKLSYTRCEEIFKECLEKIGVDHKLYGRHSLRSRGATSAVSYNPNLSERVLELHGRWRSDTAKYMYIPEDVPKRLQVTSQLA